MKERTKLPQESDKNGSNNTDLRDLASPETAVDDKDDKSQEEETREQVESDPVQKDAADIERDRISNEGEKHEAENI